MCRDVAGLAEGEAASGRGSRPPAAADGPRQGLLWKAAPYSEEAPAITSPAELAGALEHLQYAVFRRYPEPVDPRRADAARQHDRERPVQDRPLPRTARTPPSGRGEVAEVDALREAIRDGRERTERLRHQAQRAELKLAQLTSLSPETFEEFVAELFEALGYEVEQVGGTGDEGADLRAPPQRTCWRSSSASTTSGAWSARPSSRSSWARSTTPGATRDSSSPRSTFSLAAEKFVAEHPIELIDGPRLVELVQEAHRARRPARAPARLVLQPAPTPPGDVAGTIRASSAQLDRCGIGSTVRLAEVASLEKRSAILTGSSNIAHGKSVR